jgi:transitional endoplasmic reticulum ATPase
MNATIRPYRAEDLGRVLDLWQRQDDERAQPGLTLDQAVDLLHSGPAIALVADREGEIVGAVLGSSAAAIAWVHRLTVLPDPVHETEIAEALIEQLEALFAEAGVRRIGAVVADGGAAREQLERRDYRETGSSRYLERTIPTTLAVSTELADAQGRIVSPRLWEELKGLEEAKEIIEKRVILPLAEPEMAARHAVSPPRAIVLFGPPGTGKTTFAKGIASRLEWPFVEIQPSELAGEGPERQAKALAESFDRILGLPAAVTFVDEVEDLASLRHEKRRVSPSVTNEFLKQIPRLREAPEHLLVCATNWVARLDPAFLRPGRFDYVLPVGPPDEEARAAIWTRYVDEIADGGVDIGALVEASELFTPADIEFAARKAAQLAFEREYFERADRRATTDDFLTAIRQTRSSLSAEMIEAFEEQAREFARF